MDTRYDTQITIAGDGSATGQPFRFRSGLDRTAYVAGVEAVREHTAGRSAGELLSPEEARRAVRGAARMADENPLGLVCGALAIGFAVGFRVHNGILGLLGGLDGGLPQ
mgnify:CR=1 FL=1